MAAPQTNVPWVAGTPPPKHPYLEGHYFTHEERSESTGIRAFSIESLLSSHSSGSECATIFDALKDHIREFVLSRYWKVPYLAFQESTEEATPATIAEKLDQIRNAFGLSMTALAKALQSSRASIYNWYETEPHRDDALKRIEALHDIARQWKEMNPYHYAPGKLMKQKLADGPSLLERLSEERLDNESIQRGLEGLLLLMEKQRKRMDRAKARSAKVSAEDESHEELMERLTGTVNANE